ncbi:MAG: flavodoxin family protein [Candidatus Merdivicinus sp.]|jgi:multimeric flavodoxin WrbA
MKVLLVNGSSRPEGCTYTALKEAAKILEAEGIACEIFQIGSSPIRDCIGCGKCRREPIPACIFDDDCVNTLLQRAAEADGFIFGTPVYYAHPSGRLLSVLDRAFYAGKSVFAHKPGFAVVSARRAGTTASLDAVTKHFTINEMPVVSSTYWNMVHGNSPAEVLQDQEGLQTMRNAARNLAWLLKCIEAGKQAGILPPQAESGNRTNFIR